MAKPRMTRPTPETTAGGLASGSGRASRLGTRARGRATGARAAVPAESRVQPQKAATLQELADRIKVCTECPLHSSRTEAVPGEGKAQAKVMIIGEAPGRQEDLTGRPFVGSSGKFLDQVMAGTGFERSDFFITNTVKCRPPSNRVPRSLEVETCTSLYLFEQIQLLNPKLIVLLGGVAVKKMLGLKSVEEARGRIIEQEGRKYFATYHPAVRFYREELAQKIQEDFARLRVELANL